MNHEPNNTELYDIVFNLIKELEGFKRTNAQLQDEINRSVIDTAIKNHQNPYEVTRLIAILPATE